jgi:hypothetical protein
MSRSIVRTLCLAAAAACLASAPSPAKAFWPYLGYGFGTPWHYGHNPGAAYVPPPPFYAVHPPVYYAPYIQARHYGASPFAWYPGMEPITYIDVYPTGAAPTPVMIENPYVAGTPAPPPPGDQASTDGQPLRIDNPHVARR